MLVGVLLTMSMMEMELVYPLLVLYCCCCHQQVYILVWVIIPSGFGRGGGGGIELILQTTMQQNLPMLDRCPPLRSTAFPQCRSDGLPVLCWHYSEIYNSSFLTYWVMNGTVTKCCCERCFRRMVQAVGDLVPPSATVPLPGLVGGGSCCRRRYQYHVPHPPRHPDPPPPEAVASKTLGGCVRRRSMSLPGLSVHIPSLRTCTLDGLLRSRRRSSKSATDVVSVCSSSCRQTTYGTW